MLEEPQKRVGNGLFYEATGTITGCPKITLPFHEIHEPQKKHFLGCLTFDINQLIIECFQNIYPDIKIYTGIRTS